MIPWKKLKLAAAIKGEIIFDVVRQGLADRTGSSDFGTISRILRLDIIIDQPKTAPVTDQQAEQDSW